MKIDKLVFCTAGFLNGLGYLATDLYLPSLPAITKYFNTTNEYSQLSITLYLLSLGCSQVIYGPLSDMYGRKKVILFGLFIAILGSFAIVYSNSIYMLLFGRVVQGLGLGVTMSLSRAIFADLYSGPMLAKVISYMGILLPIVLDFSPILGGYLQEKFNWHANFIFLTGCITFLFLLILFTFTETNKNLQKNIGVKNIFKTYGSLIKNRQFLGYNLAYSSTLAAIFIYAVASPFLLQNIVGLTPFEYGLTSLVVGSSVILGGVFNSFFIKYFSLTALIIFGSTVMTIAGLILCITAYFGKISTLIIVGIYFFHLLGGMFVYSNAYAMAIKECKNTVGIGSSLFTFLQITISGAASLVIAILPEKTHMPMSVGLLVTGFLPILFVKFAEKNSLKVNND